ncbi:MAG: hypothetical protein HQ543_11755, partial [Bacteroidetes bacterium]|nr:hypothetical protein [Bacteroidota bacterium]
NYDFFNDRISKICPVYDLVASELVVEGDDEELALNLNGKKNNKLTIQIKTENN